MPKVPKEPAKGSHIIALGSTFYIERSDFREVGWAH